VDGAVGPPRAIEDASVGALGRGAPDRAFDGGAIDGIDPVEEVLQRSAERARREAVQRLEHGRPADDARRQIGFPDADARRLDRETNALLGLAQRRLGLALRAAELPFVDRALYGLAEPRQAILQEVVGRAAVEQRHGGGLGKAARDDDEGNVGLARPQGLEGRRGREAGGVAVGEDDVQSAVDRRRIAAFVVGHGRVDIERRLQFTEDQLGIFRIVFEKENMKRHYGHVIGDLYRTVAPTPAHCQ
jgi:hypothetical protein